MKVTIYELLGMVKDGKKLPKRVKVLDVIYEFDDHYGDYYNEELNRYLFVYMTSEEEWKLAFFLNIQVEILEEENKIPEKLNTWYGIEHVNLDSPTTFKDSSKYIDFNTEMFFDKINEIINYLDYIKSKGDE